MRKLTIEETAAVSGGGGGDVSVGDISVGNDNAILSGNSVHLENFLNGNNVGNDILNGSLNTSVSVRKGGGCGCGDHGGSAD